jgi:hypothetical protein
MIAKLLVLALCALGFAAAQPGRTCATVTVPPCQIRVARDLLFLVDASDSLDPLRFQTEMLNYVQSLFCAFNTNDINRAGMITFASEITTRIPLDRYTPTQWFQKVDEVRAQNLCCSCCTPTATAFMVAREVFEAIPIGNAFRIVFVVTDGAPWQNPNGPFAWPTIPSATYTWGTVPQQSLLLKQMVSESNKMRVMMVGVPNKNGDPPRDEYFKGIPDPEKRPDGKAPTWQCQIRNGRKTCFEMKNPPFPIVSFPFDKNIFSTTSFDVQQLITLTVGSLCEILPTNSPTTPPTTGAPTKAPTKAPTTGPTKAPTKGPTAPPSVAPTNPPTFTPTRSPTNKPTFAPSRSPSMAPIRPELEGLDMYLLLDRSRSMRWVPDLCRAAPGGNPEDGDAVACWRLFLKFVEQIVARTVQIPYRNTILGWKGSYPELKRGLRLWIYAFACSDGQSNPIVIHLGEKIDTLAAFQEVMAKAGEAIPNGGTCPGAAIERAVAMVQGNDLLTRIYKTAILISDGVFYDGMRPIEAAQGLFHLNVLTYAMGIAIPSEDNNWGLTPEEIARQRKQLRGFVKGDDSRLFNFGVEGLNLLPAIAQELADQLPYDAINNLPSVTKEPYWCGWTSIARCTETNGNDNVNTGQFCYWNYDKNRCLSKSWCKYTKKVDCQKDKYCVFTNGKCTAKPGVVG